MFAPRIFLLLTRLVLRSGDALIKSVADNCANTAVIINTVGPVIVTSFIDHPNVTAVLNAQLPGQESGNSLVDVIFGAVNPSGRLPYTMGKLITGKSSLYFPLGQC